MVGRRAYWLNRCSALPSPRIRSYAMWLRERGEAQSQSIRQRRTEDRIPADNAGDSGAALASPHHGRNTMTLATPSSITALIRACNGPTPVAIPRGSPHVAPPVRDRRMHCKCRKCPQCLDNARWERIFAEKFADPNYYTRSAATHMASPLTSL